MSARIYEYLSRDYCQLLILNASSQKISLAVKWVSGGLTIAIQSWSTTVSGIYYLQRIRLAPRKVPLFRNFAKEKELGQQRWRPEMNDLR